MSEPDLRADDVIAEDKGGPFVTLLVSAGTDPHTRDGRPSRDPMYRLRLALKRLQRDFGLVIRAHRNPLVAELEPQPCPRCSGPLDAKSRCWKCGDWRCACGAWTGSPVISVCLQCQRAATETHGV